MVNIKAVIFDLDGTLACTAADLLYAINGMLEKIELPEITMEEMMRDINYGEREFVEKLVLVSAEKSGRSGQITVNSEMVDYCSDTYLKIYNEHYCDKTYIYEGLAKVIAKIKAHGIRLAIDTNKMFEQADGMAAALLPGMFEIVVGDGMYTPKPSPVGALKIAEQFGLKPDEILFVGDSDVDMETAINAGMHPAGVTWGYRDEAVLRESGAEYIVHTPADLLDICGICG